MRKNYTHRLDVALMDELDRRCQHNNTPIKSLSKARVIEHVLRSWLNSPDGMALLPPAEDSAAQA